MPALLPLLALACDSDPAEPPPTPAPVAEPAPAAAPAAAPAPAGRFHTRITPFDPVSVEGIQSGVACWGEANGQTVIYDDLTNLWVGIDGRAVKANGVNIIDENTRLFDVEGLNVGLYLPESGQWLQEQAEGAMKLQIEWKCGD